VIEIPFGGVMAHVVVRVGKNLVESVIPKRSVDEMNLKVGDTVSAVIKSPALATYVVFAAEDGYQVVFSLAELDSGIEDSGVIVADTMDSAAVPAKRPLPVGGSA